MKNFKISTRILGTFAILVALLLVVVATALMQLRSMRESAQTISGNALPSVEIINVLNTDLVTVRLLELRHVNNDDPAYLADVEKQFDQLQQRLVEEKKSYEPLIHSEAERQIYKQFLQERTRYMELNKQLFDTSRSGDKEQAKLLLNGESFKLYNESLATLQRLIKYNGEIVQTETRASEAVYSRAIMMLAVAAVLALLLAIIAGILLVRSIRGPLHQAVKAADRVASGDLSGVIHVDREDETGQLRACRRAWCRPCTRCV